MDKVSLPVGVKQVPLEFKDGKYHIGGIVMEPEQAKQLANWILNNNYVSEGNSQAIQQLNVIKQALQIAIQCMEQIKAATYNQNLNQPIAVLQELLRSA